MPNRKNCFTGNEKKRPWAQREKNQKKKNSFSARGLGQTLLVPRQRPVSADLMLDDGAGVAGQLGLGGGAAGVGVVQGLGARHGGGQVGQPFADVVGVGVVAFALEQGVEDPEVWLRVDSRGGAEAPAAVVGREVAVDEALHEVALAQAPVEEQVLGQEGGDRHPGPVVHVTRLVHLPHRRVDERVARSAVAPRLEVAARVFPRDVGVLRFERFVHAG